MIGLPIAIANVSFVCCWACWNAVFCIWICSRIRRRVGSMAGVTAWATASTAAGSISETWRVSVG